MICMVAARLSINRNIMTAKRSATTSSSHPTNARPPSQKINYPTHDARPPMFAAALFLRRDCRRRRGAASVVDGGAPATTTTTTLTLTTMPVLLMVMMLAFLVLGSATVPAASALSVTATADLPSVSKLLERHAADITSLRGRAASILKTGDDSVEPYSNDVFYLRYCLEEPDDDERRSDLLKANLEWRLGEGRTICDAAVGAVREACVASEGGNGWDNAPVLKAAPHSERVTKYLTPDNVITTTMLPTSPDLVYCVRAGHIDDNALMKEVTVEELVDFFVYAKEVNALVANRRSVETNRLVSVLTANDLSNVKLIGGSADFRKALSGSSKRTSTLYPATSGPSLLLNLPPLVNALVKLFTPLFPRSVNERLKFAKCDAIKHVGSLTELTTGSSNSAGGQQQRREEFLKQIRGVLS